MEWRFFVLPNPQPLWLLRIAVHRTQRRHSKAPDDRLMNDPGEGSAEEPAQCRLLPMLLVASKMESNLSQILSPNFPVSVRGIIYPQSSNIKTSKTFSLLFSVTSLPEKSWLSSWCLSFEIPITSNPATFSFPALIGLLNWQIMEMSSTSQPRS